MTESQKKLSRKVVGLIYFGLLGGLLGWLVAFISESNVIAMVGAFSLSMAMVGSGVFADNVLIAMLGASVGSEFLTATGIPTKYVAIAWLWGFAFTVGLTLKIIARQKNKTFVILIDEHISWLLSLPITSFLSHCRASFKVSNKSQLIKISLVDRLIINLTQGLAEVFPEKWDEWQPEMECMMAFRQRQLSKGISHSLISLITFYHFSLFIWHIGIDKAFIIATRRATR